MQLLTAKFVIPACFPRIVAQIDELKGQLGQWKSLKNLVVDGQKAVEIRPNSTLRHFIRKVEQADGRKLEEIVASVLRDPKTKGFMLLRLLEYRYGKPLERVEVGGNAGVLHTIRFAESPRRILEPEIVEPKKDSRQLVEPHQLEAQNDEMPISTRPSSHKGLF